jgi:uncharacterized lipoprotein YddW (UPF0748 family)
LSYLHNAIELNLLPMKAITLFLTFLSFVSMAQNSPKREFRGAWITTVGNIDFPSSKTLTTDQQKNEFINILNQHQQSGLNAVVVQIRNNGDALYQSSLEPWSEVLTGKQGQAPNPFYDPLAFMIDEAHKRGMEFHAWFNPYRAVPNVNTTVLADNHIAKTRPDILLAFGNLRILDPGHPDSRSWVTKVVMDVVRRYDIDAVHFDDYFYPYPSTGVSFNDDSTYAKYNRGILNRSDWRRDNVDQMVKMVSDSIKSAKPYVKFGISPFGIWQNKSTAQPLGSDTKGLESYNDIFANSIKWSQQKWVDYMVPQLYWYIGFSIADYGKLLDWWSKNANDRHFYVGQGAYRIAADTNWNAQQMPRQIRLNRTNAAVTGSVFYNTTTLNKNSHGFRDSLRNDFYRLPALPPAMPWIKSAPPLAPINLTAQLNTDGVLLKWNQPITGQNEMDKIKKYIIYRFNENEVIDINNPKNIKAIILDNKIEYVDKDNTGNKFKYVVTSLDRLNNESVPSNMVQIPTVSVIEEDYNKTNQLFQNFPNPTLGGKTMIPYYIAKSAKVQLSIYNIMGIEVRRIVDADQTQGSYEVEVDGLVSGFYLYTLKVDKSSYTHRMIVK